ncbi:MAG: hypothetical protein CL910_20810 [Deltaproteobacteria bacterium]|nr:hypothetical protein [Deltaproteobacteria bacterium]
MARASEPLEGCAQVVPVIEVEASVTDPSTSTVFSWILPVSNGHSSSILGTWGGGSAFVGTSTVSLPTTTPVSKVTIVAGSHSSLSVTAGGSVTGGVQRADVCAFLFKTCAIAYRLELGTTATNTSSGFGIFHTVQNQK